MKLDAALRAVPRFGARDRPVSFFEFWPGWLFYTPVVAHWIALGLRYRGMLLPTAANPWIPAGGLCGESKTGILDQVTGEARRLLVPYTTFVTGAGAAGDLPLAERTLAEAGIDFPLVAKPDIGCNGTGVRLLHDRGGLARYLEEYPRRQRVVLQTFAPEKGEAGLFYVRPPGATRGRVTSITIKHVPTVTGDGRSTLRALILADPRAGRVPHLYLPRLQGLLHTVPAAGERVPLVFVGNHCKGSVFEDATGERTDALANLVEEVARALPEFHFGRIDVRFTSRAALHRGEGLRIIEINGAGSEATHIWDPRTSLMEAWRTQFQHYGAAFRIGAANRARGYRPSSIPDTLRLWRLQRRLMASYPLND